MSKGLGQDEVHLLDAHQGVGRVGRVKRIHIAVGRAELDGRVGRQVADVVRVYQRCGAIEGAVAGCHEEQLAWVGIIDAVVQAASYHGAD